MCQRIGGQTLWDNRGQDRQCVSQVGLLGSGSALSPGQSRRPKVSDPIGEKTRPGQSVDAAGPEAGAGRLLRVKTPKGFRSGPVSPGIVSGAGEPDAELDV